MIAPLVFASMGFGEEGGVELTPSGFGSFEIGQVVQANPLTTKDADFYQSEHLLFQKIFIGFNLQASYEPLPMTTNLGAGNANFKVNHCNVIEVPKMLVKWMFYNDSAWVRFVRGEVAIKSLHFVPIKTPETDALQTEIKTYDLLGKIVKLKRIVINNSAITTSPTAPLPPGVYIITGIKHMRPHFPGMPGRL